MSVFDISVTSISKSGTCPLRWYELDFKRRQSTKPSSYMILGSLVHAALEAFYLVIKEKGRGAYNVHEPLKLFDVGRLAVAKEAQKFAEQYQDDVALVDSLTTKALLIYENYLYNGDPVPKWMHKVIDVEKFFELPIGKFNVRGVIDLVVEDTNGNMVIIDHKTRSRTTADINLNMMLSIDIQMQVYAYAATVLYNKPVWKLGHNILLSKPPVKGGLYLKKGVTRAKGKLEHTIPQYYEEAIKESGESLSSYADELAYVRKVSYDYFFSRIFIFHNDDQQQHHLENLTRHLDQLAIMVEEPEKYIFANPSTYNCDRCPMLSYCYMKATGADTAGYLDELFEYRERSHF